MSTPRFPEPPRPSILEIEADTAFARDLYARHRPQEGKDAYSAAHGEGIRQVTELLTASDDLKTLVDTLRRRPDLLDVARYLDAPPISADDLETVSGQSKASHLERATIAKAEVVASGLDLERFPWLAGGGTRGPAQAERESAIRITASLIAAQRAATVLRNGWATRQERAVADLLRERGYHEAARRTIDSMSDLASGSFCPESLVFGQKCDVPVGLWNGRYLLIECKVSGSAVNSYKRLNHETVNKCDEWRRGFAAQAYTAAVLGGVFRPSNVIAAQERGVTIFWEHDLTPLARFLDATH